MTYFGFLIRFLIIPIVILGVLTYLDRRRGIELPRTLRLLPPWLVITALAVIAVVYTTPWDNYLVATGVWWYDPALVTGIVLGWVPLEEYLFFVLQTVMAGLWLLFLARHLRVRSPGPAWQNLRLLSTVAVGVIWVASVALLASGWGPGRYLALALTWALPPIALQLAVGADILWRYRRLVLLTLFSATLYLCAVDALAIASGTWTINPALSLGVMLGVRLPIEEAVFFLLTNTLLVFGMVLGLANECRDRLPFGIAGALANRNRRAARQMGSATLE